MIEVCFHFPIERFEAVIDAILLLPDQLKPLRFGHDEGVKKAKDVVADGERFRSFLGKSASGFFLYGEHAVYSFRITKSVDFVMDVEGVNAEQATALLRALGPAGVSFAYASDSAERDHRNRLVKEASYGVHEAWVGRDWKRNIPGLYWSILVPEALAERHGTPLDQLKAAAEDVEEVTSRLWLMRFYDFPGNWQSHAERLDKLCAFVPGVFSIEPVRARFEATSTFMEATAVLQEWR